jgi:hypothetical protein
VASDDTKHTTDDKPLSGYVLQLWQMLEEVQAQVELPDELDDQVTALLWRNTSG